MRVVFAGTPVFAASALKALVEAGHDVPLVLTRPDKPAGRGLKSRSSEVKLLATTYGLPILQPVKLNEPDIERALAEAGAQAMVVAAYGLILPPKILNAFSDGCINIHASLLPRWRGAAPIQRAILAGDATSGISIMRMEAGLDTGPLFAQQVVSISNVDTARTLHDKLAEAGSECLLQVLTELASAQLYPTPQCEAEAIYAAKVTKEEADIDWRQRAIQIDRMVRAFNPFPVALTRLRGEPLRIWKASVLETRDAKAGEVCAVDSSGIDVGCGSGLLRIRVLQRAGAKRLTVAEFLRGTPVSVGEALG